MQLVRKLNLLWRPVLNSRSEACGDDLKVLAQQLLSLQCCVSTDASLQQLLGEERTFSGGQVSMADHRRVAMASRSGRGSCSGPERKTSSRLRMKVLCAHKRADHAALSGLKARTAAVQAGK